MQLFSGWFLNRAGSRKKFVVLCAVLQAVTIASIAVQPSLPAGAELGLILIVTLYWLFGLSAGPPWNTWIVDLVPDKFHNRFFSERGRIHEISLMFAIVGVGYFLQLRGGSLLAFRVVFLIAGAFRLVSAFCLAMHPEGKSTIQPPEPLSLSEFRQWVKNPLVRQVLIYLGLFQFGVYIGAPYFTAFLIRNLKFSYETYMLVLAVPFISRALSYQFNEIAVNKFGAKKVLLLSALVVATVPLFWSQFTDIGAFLFLQFIAGWAWAGFEYCSLIMQLNDFSNAERSRVLTWSNFVVGICMSSGIMVGYVLMGSSPSHSDYQTVFSISALFRLLPIIVLLRINWSIAKPTFTGFAYRLVAVRPNKGSIIRPIFSNQRKEEKE